MLGFSPAFLQQLLVAAGPGEPGLARGWCCWRPSLSPRTPHPVLPHRWDLAWSPKQGQRGSRGQAVAPSCCRVSGIAVRALSREWSLATAGGRNTPGLAAPVAAQANSPARW